MKLLYKIAVIPCIEGRDGDPIALATVHECDDAFIARVYGPDGDCAPPVAEGAGETLGAALYNARQDLFGEVGNIAKGVAHCAMALEQREENARKLPTKSSP